MTTAIHPNSYAEKRSSCEEQQGKTMEQARTSPNLCPLVAIPADWISSTKQGEWTYETYAALPEDGHRYEVLDGVLYLMPSPNEKHQYISMMLSLFLGILVQIPRRGRVYAAPFDVEFSLRNVLQPDIIVLLNEHLDRITSTRIVGAPDLVVEIASPSTAARDRQEKREAYAQAGVSEYWLVHPKQETVEILALENGLYSRLGIFSGSEVLYSRVLPDLSVQAEQLFPPQIS